MKTNSKLLLFAILAPLIASSCNKDESKLPFSELSVEQNKQVVENSAIDAARVLDAMKDHAAVDASVSLGTHLERAFPLELKAIKNSKALNTIDAVAAMGSKDANINVLFKELVSPEELADDPSSIQDVWDMVVGIYD